MAGYPTEENTYPTEEHHAAHTAAGADADAAGRTTSPIVVKRRPTLEDQQKRNGSHDATAAGAHSLIPQEDEREDNGPQDYAKSARDMDAVKAEVAQLEEDEQTVEQRLQLYSEVIALRKELQVVQQDEGRLRRQRDNTERIVAEHDREINKEVAVLEDEAQQTALQKIWKEESAIHNPEKMDWATIDITNLSARVAASKAAVEEANTTAEAFYAEQETKINVHTDSRERTKQQLRESYEEEMGNLAEARQRMRQVESEHHFHHHRGTTRGRQPAVNKAKNQFNRERRVDQAENRTTQQVDQMNSQLTDLMEECKVLKKQLDESKRINQERTDDYETQLKGIEEEGTEARELKEKLEKEKDELTALKADLQGVLHYVRAKNREEDDY